MFVSPAYNNIDVHTDLLYATLWVPGTDIMELLNVGRATRRREAVLSLTNKRDSHYVMSQQWPMNRITITCLALCADGSYQRTALKLHTVCMLYLVSPVGFKPTIKFTISILYVCSVQIRFQCPQVLITPQRNLGKLKRPHRPCSSLTQCPRQLDHRHGTLPSTVPSRIT